MRDPAQQFFKLRRPCANCPFLKEGGIELAPGRLEGIAEGLLSDDWSSFHCHKTTHRDGAEEDDDGEYQSSGRESMCAGAIIYLEKAGRPSVAMRVGRAFKVYDPVTLAPFYELVVDPFKTA